MTKKKSTKLDLIHSLEILRCTTRAATSQPAPASTTIEAYRYKYRQYAVSTKSYVLIILVIPQSSVVVIISHSSQKVPRRRKVMQRKLTRLVNARPLLRRIPLSTVANDTNASLESLSIPVSASASSSSAADVGSNKLWVDKLLHHRRGRAQNPSKISWYSCGPTVYDAAHIGHARTYVCSDIIRRVIEDIFGKEVDYAIGVTDIDDKIINRGFENGLQTWSQMETMVRRLEDDFFRDLDELNVQRPNAVLRVTEHIDDIIRYIEQIQRAGKAYTTPDGVYFDVSSSGDGYMYFRERGLPDMSSVPSSPNSSGANPLDEQSDADNAVIIGGYKRDPRDFALWKTAKNETEPCWDSPWGAGRPGWHIECSAVTHSYFGTELDIHSGGVDLKFPHHTNEIAQCAAHNCAHAADWVKHWIHTGHLYIEGRKMSKSLKNFVSIRDFLNGEYSTHPALDFRIFCLQHKYHSSVHFSQDRIDDAANYRRKVEGFLRIADGVRANRLEQQNATERKRPTEESRKIVEFLSGTRKAIRTALMSDFDTPEALRHISYLVGEGIKYASVVANQPNEPVEPLLAVSRYVIEVTGKLGLPLVSAPSAASNAVHDRITVPAAMETLLTFRSKVRAASLGGSKAMKVARKGLTRDDSGSTGSPSEAAVAAVTAAGGAFGEVLQACDWVRDTACPAVGVHVEDVSESLSTWRKSD